MPILANPGHTARFSLPTWSDATRTPHKNNTLSHRSPATGSKSIRRNTLLAKPRLDFAATQLRSHNVSVIRPGDILNRLQQEQHDRMQLAALLPVPAAVINQWVEQAIVRHFPPLPADVAPLAVGIHLPAHNGTASRYMLLTELITRRLLGEAFPGVYARECVFYQRKAENAGDILHDFTSPASRAQLAALYEQTSATQFVQHYAVELRSLLSKRPGQAGWKLAESLLMALQSEVMLREKIDISYLRYSKIINRLPPLKPGTDQPCWPGVYRLVAHQEQAEQSAVLNGYLALAERPSLSHPGRMMLWHPGEATQFFNHSRQLLRYLDQHDLAPWGFRLQAIEQHPALALVEDLILLHVDRLRETLSRLIHPDQAQLALKKKIAQLNAAARPAYIWLDLSRLTTALTEISAEYSLRRWFNAPDGGERRKNWLKTLQQLHAIPSRHALPRVQGRVSAEGIRLFAKKRVEETALRLFNTSLDANKAELRISTVVASTSVLGHSGRPIIQTQEMSLIEWSLQNIGWLDRGHSRKVWHCGELTPLQVIALIRTADVAKHYKQHITRELQPEVVPLVAAGFRSMAYTDYIRQSMLPAANRTMDERALDKIITAIDFPDPATRPRTNQKEVEIWQLKVGNTPISETLIFCHPGFVEPVIYIPRSPDGIVCRTAGGKHRSLTRLLHTVMAVKGMRDHLSKRMAVGTDDRAEIERSYFRPQQFEVQKVSGDFYQHLWDTRIATIQAEIPAFARSTSEADRTSSIQLAKQISMLVASLVTPLLPTSAIISLTLARVVLHTHFAIEDFSRGRTEEGIFSLVDALTAVADGAPGVLKNRLSPRKMSRAPNPSLVPLTIGGSAPPGLVATAASEGPVWQNQQGQQYLNITGLWFKSKVSFNGRMIYHPRNRGDMYPVYYVGHEWVVSEDGKLDPRLLFIKDSHALDEDEFSDFIALLNQRYPTAAGRNRFLQSRQGNYGDVEILSMVAESQKSRLQQRIQRLQQRFSSAIPGAVPAVTPSPFSAIHQVKNTGLLLSKFRQQNDITRLKVQYPDTQPASLAKLIAEVKNHYAISTPAKMRQIQRAQKQRNDLLEQRYRQQSQAWHASAERQPFGPLFFHPPSEKQMIDMALQRSRGIVFGQRQEENSALALLIHAMPQLKSQGVKHLFMAQLIPEIWGAELQQFNQQGRLDQKLLDYLMIHRRYWLNNRLQESQNDEQQVMLSAHQQGIKLHGLGLLAIASYHSSAARCNRFNFIAAQQINQVVAPGEKFVALVGLAHIDSWHTNTDEEEFSVTGLAPGTQATSVAVIAARSGNQSRLIVDYQRSTARPEQADLSLNQCNFLLVKAEPGLTSRPVTSGA
ncbi:membrane-targeted effector domain-containing toxin [Candidatus Pantoea multigeneris]|uniref:Dermonecrotic toxin N-terminal domain-containing protein n=1 Tax=Candidatus Pantoea multigeneris TaxID=2608357 RepID=A0ABX0R6C5_9GAMM|nr:membrane-targeted effector domain-containing toxin [Pantoea multigeneris]NIF20329.1 hypothetical protein [Pantoea multigeneris]